MQLGNQIILHDLVLEIPQGESTAILGPNGAGKTTLLKLLTRDLYPLRGARTAVRILGRDRWNVFDLREQMGLVSHELQIRYQRRVRGSDVVLSGFFASIGVYPHQALSDEHRERATAVMERVGVHHLAERTFDTLSAGEQRRFLLARALVHDPHTLLLDEPTTSLDLKASFELLGLLRELAREGKTLLLVTHHLREIPPEIDRVVLLRAGRIVFDGRKEEALTSQRMSALFEVPMRIVEQKGFYQALPE